MNKLSKVITAKIAITVLAWCTPLLLSTDGLLHRFRVPVPQEMLVFLKLLGVAYVALVVSYAFGLQATMQNRYPKGVVWVGIVSNGGAFITLLVAAMQGIWATWGGCARAGMWFSLVATGGITAGLIWFGPCGSMNKIRE